MGIFVAIYYNIVISWSMFYMYASFTSVPSVPWASCGNPWNTDQCFIANGSSVLPNNTISPSQEYFYNHVLGITSGIDQLDGLRWHLVTCLAVAWALVFFGLCLGAKSLGKVSYFTALFPYLMITGLLVKGVQLPNSFEGIALYLLPDLSKLATVDIWADAATQIFFSLSVCTGGVITLSSYNPLFNNTFKWVKMFTPRASLRCFLFKGLYPDCVGKLTDQCVRWFCHFLRDWLHGRTDGQKCRWGGRSGSWISFCRLSSCTGSILILSHLVSGLLRDGHHSWLWLTNDHCRNCSLRNRRFLAKKISEKQNLGRSRCLFPILSFWPSNVHRSEYSG